MSFKVFHDDFVTFLTNNWAVTPIVESVNVPNEPTGVDPFISYRTDFNSTETNTITGLGQGGQHSKVRDIIMSIIVFVPSSSGEDLAIDLAQQIEDLFTNVSFSTGSYSRDAEIVFSELSEGLWWKTEIAIFFENQELIN